MTRTSSTGMRLFMIAPFACTCGSRERGWQQQTPISNTDCCMAVCGLRGARTGAEGVFALHVQRLARLLRCERL
jgi:hypothetical protein